MDASTCPKCERLFGRKGQGHDCAPGLSLDEYFDGGPPHERPIFDAVVVHLETLGPLHLDIVSVGVFFKNPRKFAELRPMTRWVALSFMLDSGRSHSTIKRKVIQAGPGRFWHTANLAEPSDYDVDLQAMLEEAYLVS